MSHVKIGPLINVFNFECNSCTENEDLKYQIGSWALWHYFHVMYSYSSVLMGRLSSLVVKLGDKWKVEDGGNRLPVDYDDPLATNRPALIFVHGDLEWDR